MIIVKALVITSLIMLGIGCIGWLVSRWSKFCVDRNLGFEVYLAPIMGALIFTIVLLGEIGVKK